MSIAANVISEVPLAGQPAVASSPTATTKPPRKRRITARADSVEQPEAR
jgi:hypothetical protein